MNDGNYCMAVYEGPDRRGRTKRSFEIVSKLEAAAYFKASADRTARPDLVPLNDADGRPLKCILKVGTMVLFYEHAPEELRECTPKELAKRLYKVTGLSMNGSYGRLTLKYHQEARPAKELKVEDGPWKIGEAYRPVIRIYYTQLNACVEGYDFELTVAGELKFKR